jgi:iron(III) transport system substrate-binding protein
MTRRHRSRPRAVLAFSCTTAALLATTLPAHAAEELTLYTTREPGLIQPLISAFGAQNNVKVNTVFVKDGLLERIKAEGARSPADLLMTVDIGNLMDLVDGGVTQPVKSAALDSAIPANLRGADGQWYALSMRARVLYADKDMPLTSFRYEDLANPKYKGRVCIRAGQHPYNTALVSAMIAHDGEAKTEQWLRGVKGNLARKATGGDRDVARDILGGICDVGLANSYYVGQMKASKEGTDARKWGDAIKVIKPTFADAKSGGTHVNISGAAVAKHAPNRGNAVKLLEFLASPSAQALYAEANYEYPVRQGVALDPIIASSIGDLKVDPLPVAEIAKYRKQASALIDKVAFDQ